LGCRICRRPNCKAFALRNGSERPRHGCAAEKSNEIAPPHARPQAQETALYRLKLGLWKRLRVPSLTSLSARPDIRKGSCVTSTVRLRRCATVPEMKEGPSRPAVRGRPQTTASCCRQKRWWCCVKKTRERHAVRE